MVQSSLGALKALNEKGIDPTIIDVCAIKPTDEEGIAKILESNDEIFTVEEHSVTGGLGSLVAELASAKCPRFVHRLGMYGYAESASADVLLHEYRLDGEGVAEQILGYLK